MSNKKQKYQQYLNIPYKHLGRDRKGLDCYGLLLLYYKEILGYEIKDWYYEENWSKKGQNFFLEKYKDFHFVRVNVPIKNDVVLFCMDIHCPIPNHLSIVVEAPNVALSAEKSGVCLIDINRPIWKRRIQGYYRLCQN